jgi:predicted TIM-barrel fold metal-dependent hydrolase
MSIARPSLIDCDVHAVLPGIAALLPYLSDYWREQIAQTGFKGPVDRWYPPRAVAAAATIKDEIPASKVEYLQRDVLDARPELQWAILNCDCAVETLHNPDAAAAVASALNEWIAAEWLARDPRLRASIVVPSQFPELAAAEIDRMSGRPGFVQVLLPVRSAEPYGSRNFRPLFAAAARHGLPVGLHFGGAPGNPPTPVGWPSFYLEEYAGMTSVFQTQLISVVAGGLFDTFPDLRLVLIEAGVAWLPPMLWRLDKNWKGLRREIPWVRRLPSEYVRAHVRLTTAPFDAPDDARQLGEVVAQLGSDSILLYASDYPHAHGEDRAVTELEFLPPALATRIKCENARAVYRFEP